MTSSIAVLPLKKRPIKDVYEVAQVKNEPSQIGHQFAYEDVKAYIFKKHCSSLRSSSPSEYSIHSYDSGYPESPLDLSNSSLKSASPNVFEFEAEEISDCLEETGQPIQCPECNKLFLNKIRYRAHLRRHASKRSGRYRCAVCLKTFVQKSSLATHLRIHTGEKPFKCQQCDDSFGDFSTYTKHKRIHSGEKPYRCPVCARSFSQSGNMHRHYNTIHRKTN